METFTDGVLREMIRYNAGDPKRIQHALKVYAFAGAIGREEGLPEERLELLETAALLHDIGIRNSERKYGSAAGNYQELEGPPVARRILEPMGKEPAFVERVCFLIGHHHTYGEIVGEDYRILVESDLLVNLFEDGLPEPQVREVLRKYFRTDAGTRILKRMYLRE
jgi:hypothetical protein